MTDESGLDAEGFPTMEGVYSVTGTWDNKEVKEVNVYYYPIKGMCCYTQDFHVIVQETGLKFNSRLRDLESLLRK